MKVLFLSHMFPNILEPLFAVFVCEKAKAIFQHVDLQIVAPVSFFPFVTKRSRIGFIEEFDGLKIRHPKYFAIPDKLFAFRWVPYYLALIKAIGKEIHRYDLINVEWIYPDCYAALKIATKLGKKVVVTTHGNEAIGYLENTHKKLKYIQALQKVDHIISVSNDLKYKMINEYAIPESKISVIPNGVDIKKFTPIKQDEAKKFLNLNTDGKKVCVSITRLSEEKSVHTMIEAISLCDEDIILYIIGDGPLKDAVNKKVQDLSLERRVFLVGAKPHNELIYWLNSADFFLLSSVREGCPVVIHEALACGVPVVSTDVGGIPDIVKNDQHGILCHPDNPQLFADALRKAVSTNWNRSKISEYGQAYTWDRVAKETVNIYERLMS